ncbi:MAG: hypothetical protein H5U03_01040 [Clostridia bacterium]|nr:hypothetical protein [Clostridia bacterium]
MSKIILRLDPKRIMEVPPDRVVERPEIYPPETPDEPRRREEGSRD